MPSTATTRVRAEQIGEFEKTNAWATALNNAIQRLDDAIGQFTTIALVGNYTLSSANFIQDEARAAMLRFTGTGTFTVTAPAVSKLYCIINDCTGDLTIQPSGGTGAVVRAGTRMVVAVDTTIARVFDTTLDRIAAPVASVSLNSQKITNLAAPTLNADAATKGYVDTFTADRSAGGFKLTSLALATTSTDAASKAYVDSIAFGGAIPAGSAGGQVLTWNGSAYVWGAVDLADTDARTGILPVANGGSGLNTLATGSVPVGNGTGAFTAVAPGVSGTVLMSNGAGVAPSFQSASPSGLVLLRATTASSVASVDFTSDITSTYAHYLLVIDSLIPSTAGVDLLFRTSANGGSTFDTSGYTYRANRMSSSNISAPDATSTTTGSAIFLAQSNFSVQTTAPGYSGQIMIFNPLGSKPCQVIFEGSFIENFSATGALTLSAGHGMRNASSAVNAIRVLCSTGNIASGAFRLYGMRA